MKGLSIFLLVEEFSILDTRNDKPQREYSISSITTLASLRICKNWCMQWASVSLYRECYGRVRCLMITQSKYACTTQDKLRRSTIDTKLLSVTSKPIPTNNNSFPTNIQASNSNNSIPGGSCSETQEEPWKPEAKSCLHYQRKTSSGMYEKNPSKDFNTRQTTNGPLWGNCKHNGEIADKTRATDGPLWGNCKQNKSN